MAAQPAPRAESSSTSEGCQLAAQHVRRELHEEGVVLGASIGVYERYGPAGGRQLPIDVGYLICDRFLGGADHVFPPAAYSEAEDGGPHIAAPIGRAQAGEGRHQVYPSVVLQAGGYWADVPAVLDEAQFVSQPDDERPGVIDIPLRHIAEAAVQLPAHGAHDPPGSRRAAQARRSP